jgi:hypothetical protein
MRRTIHFGKMWFINNRIVIAICSGRYHAECNLDYSMIRAGVAEYSVRSYPFKRKKVP